MGILTAQIQQFGFYGEPETSDIPCVSPALKLAGSLTCAYPQTTSQRLLLAQQKFDAAIHPFRQPPVAVTVCAFAGLTGAFALSAIAVRRAFRRYSVSQEVQSHALLS